MNKNLPVIFLISLLIIFILFLVYNIFKIQKDEGYVAADYQIDNSQFINRIINSPLTYEEMLEGFQPLRNSPYWESYFALKEIIGFLKAPNFRRFQEDFIHEAVRWLNGTDFNGRPRFTQQIRQYIFDLLNQAELPQPPVNNNNLWDNQPPPIVLPGNGNLWFGDEGNLEVVPVPPDQLDEEINDAAFPPLPPFDNNINLVPQPFLPPQININANLNNFLNAVANNNNINQDDMDIDEMN